MVNRNLIRGLDLTEQEWQDELAAALEGTPPEGIDWGGDRVTVNDIVQGRILRVEGEFVLVDVGYKSEGTIPLSEWEPNEPPPVPGQPIKVLIEEVEDTVGGMTDETRGMITLSKRKAEKIEAWKKVMEAVHEGDVVTGVVSRKIKGGLLVDIGVNVFLPASQVEHSPPGRHRRLHRPDDPEHRVEDRRGPAKHRRQPPHADRGGAGGEEGRASEPARKPASAARAWSRTSPISGPSSTWAASTACCTSPT